jgi:hypothetical protein
MSVIHRSQQLEAGHVGPADPSPDRDVVDGVALDGAEDPAEAAVDAVLLAVRDPVVAHHVAADVVPGPPVLIASSQEVTKPGAVAGGMAMP